jgi:hypothetical protein
MKWIKERNISFFFPYHPLHLLLPVKTLLFWPNLCVETRQPLALGVQQGDGQGLGLRQGLHEQLERTFQRRFDGQLFCAAQAQQVGIDPRRQFAKGKGVEARTVHQRSGFQHRPVRQVAYLAGVGQVVEIQRGWSFQ